MDLGDETMTPNGTPRPQEYKSLCKTFLLEAFTLTFIVNLVIGLLSSVFITSSEFGARWVDVEKREMKLTRIAWLENKSPLCRLHRECLP